MAMFSNELRKLFSLNITVIVIVCLLGANLLLLINGAYNSGGKNNYYSPGSYRALYKELENLDNEEQLLWINNRASNIEKEGAKYCNTLRGEMELLSDAYTLADTCSEYSEFLADIKSKATFGLSLGLYSDPDSFAFKNMTKTVEDYEKLAGVKPIAGPQKGFIAATETLATDIFLVIAIMLIVTGITLREREVGELSLNKTTYNGREKLSSIKLLTVVVVTLIFTGVFYGINFLFGMLSYGFGDLSRPIQSIEIMGHCNMPLSVGEYLTLYILTKCFVMVGIACFMYYVAARSKSSMTYYLVIFISLLWLGTMYYSLNATSHLALVKYINPVAFIDTNSVIGYYRNLSIFGTPVSYSVIFVFTNTIAIFMFAYYGILDMADTKEAEMGRKTGIDFRFSKGKSHSIFVHESYKTLLGGGAIWVVLFYLCYTILSYKPVYEAYYINYDVIYNQYVEKLYGELTEEKVAYVESELQRMYTLEAMRDEEIANASSFKEAETIASRYEEFLRPKEALETLSIHTEYLQEVYGDYYIDTGFELLTGAPVAAERDARLVLLAVSMLTIILPYVWSIEYVTGANRLVRTTVHGRNKVSIYKTILGVGIVAGVFAITYVPVYVSVLSEFGTKGLELAACSMEHLYGVPEYFSVLGYILFKGIIRFAGMVGIMGIIFFLSKILKSQVYTLLVSAFLIIIPVLLKMLDIPGAEYILFNLFLF